MKQFVSCSFLFRATENPPTSAAELDSDPDSPQLDQFPLDQQRSPLVGLYHSLHNHHQCAILTIDDLKGREARVGLALGFSPSKAQRLAVDVFPKGIPRCSRLCRWENGRNACVKPLRRPPSKPFHALKHLFLLCRGFSAFWPARFSTSSRPIVIFRLISFRLIRHDRFIFFSSLPSLFVYCMFCLPRNAFTSVLQNISTSVCRHAME